MQHVSKRNKSYNRGNAILLILPLAIVVVAVIQLSLHQSVNFSKAVRNFRVMGVRDNLVSNVKAYASMPSTFRSSLHPTLPLGTNSELKNCVLGGLLQCQADVETPVALYSPISVDSGAPSLKMISGRAALGGPSSPAALYDVRGELCATTGQANANCPFEVTTSFTAKCAGGASQCAVAESISVKYTVRRSEDAAVMKANSLRASIEQTASVVLVSKILPGSEEDSNHNVVITGMTGVADPNNSDKDPAKALIERAVRDANITTIESHLQEMTDIFYNNGYKDPAFVKEVVKVAYFENDTPGLIKAISELGIKDIETAVFLSHVGIGDSKWLRIVLDTGIKNTWMAGNLYWSFQDADIDRVRVAVEVVKDLPNNQLSLAVARNVTDPSKAKETYDTIKQTAPSEFIGAGILDGKWTNDPSKMQEIGKAITHVDDWTAMGLAELGITNKDKADALYEATKVLDDGGRANQFILQAKGDLEQTKQLVKDWQQMTDQWKAEAAAQQAANQPPAAPQNPPAGAGAGTPPEISLLGQCTTCSGVSF